MSPLLSQSALSLGRSSGRDSIEIVGSEIFVWPQPQRKFVISGVFESLSREELKNKIEFNGGFVMSSISKKTDYVLAGNGIGPTKKIKAEKFGITIISEDLFFKLLND